ncbi:MAG: orotidine-5'-phosphate decarboxylase [Gloeomargaritaceae cyanobacterium C42_A2020_066]|nr:orotidine-5'-phosphate decarboxylase [Gloeomargaritaceae cyanobacterium C42_A2020_066]
MSHLPHPPAGRIILALDTPQVTEALTWLDEIPQAVAWKVGLELFIANGPAILTALKERGKQVFLDLKLHDIPNTVAGACRVAARYGVDWLTLHATAGRPALSAAVEACQASAAQAGLHPPTLLGITVLTSLTAQDLQQDLQVARTPADYALHLGRLARDCGLGGLVCSAQEVQQLRLTLGSDLTYVCPGIRPQRTPGDDQQRTVTPQAAVAAGADYLVIGRPILQAPDPAQAFAQLCQSLTGSLEGEP